MKEQADVLRRLVDRWRADCVGGFCVEESFDKVARTRTGRCADELEEVLNALAVLYNHTGFGN
jgi:hypothetical protein